MTVKTLCLGLLLLGCSSGPYKKGKSYLASGDYTSAIFHLQVAESSYPDNWQIKRDLGIAYFKNRQTRKAQEKLLEVFRQQDHDGLTLLYLGQCYEKLEAHDKGVALYQYFAGLDISDDLRDELRARLRELERKQARKEADGLLHTFRNKLATQIKPNSIAALYVRNISDWKELTPLIKGLSEVITFELQQESALTPIARLKIQSVLDQLNLSPDEFLDRYTMSQIAELLQVSYLVTGGIERIGDVQIQISLGLIEGRTGKLVGKGLTQKCSLSEVLPVMMKGVPDLLANVGLNHEETVATQNNLAFIAFSKGLDYEDKLIFPQARLQYKKAVELDPGFRLAEARLARFPENRLTFEQMVELTFHSGVQPEGNQGLVTRQNPERISRPPLSAGIDVAL